MSIAEGTGRRWALRAAVALIALAAIAFACFFLGVRALRGEVAAVLGPLGEVGDVRVSAAGVEVVDLRIGGGRDWPAADQLRARRILVTPDWRDLLSARIRLASIRIEGAYLSVLRARDGRLRLLPALLEKPATATGGQSPEILIGEIRLRDSTLDFFDATVAQPPLRVALEGVTAVIDDVQLPQLAAKTRIEASATLKGRRRDGTLSLAGWATLANKDSDLKLRLRDVDLVALQPYLIKAAETGVRKGSLDLDLHSTVHDKRLRAPGSLTLSGLELAPGSSFMGMPRSAVVGMLKDKQDRIAIKFVLEGNLADPRFSLNENFAVRAGSAVADSLGISLESLAKGVGGAGRGVGEVLGRIFGAPGR